MANIPIAEIPNAPKTGNAVVPINTNAIRGADFRGASGLLSEAGRNLQQDSAPMAAFGSYTALSDLGDRAVRAGANIADFGARMARANDDARIAEADRIRGELLSDYDARMQTEPEADAEAVWQSEYAPQLAEKVRGLKMSTPSGTARRDMWLEDTQVQTAGQVKIAGVKRQIQRDTDETMAFIERAQNEGRHEDVFAAVDRGVANGLWTGERAARMKTEYEEKVKVDGWMIYTQQNPAEARKVFRDHQAAGTTPKGMTTEQLLQFRRLSESAHGQLLSDATDSLIRGIEANPAAYSPDAVKRALENPKLDAPPEMVGKIIETLGVAYANTPEGRADRAQKYNDLWSAIFAYEKVAPADTQAVDGHLAKFQDLQMRVLDTAPPGQREPFLDQLNRIRDNARKGVDDRASQIQASLLDYTDKLAQWGKLGDMGGWNKVKQGDKTVDVPKDTAKYEAVQTRRLEITNAVRQMLRDNPNITEDEAQAKFKTIVDKHLDAGLPAESGGSWWDSLKSWFPAQSRVSEDDPAGALTGSDFLSWMKKEEGFIPNAYSDSGQISVGYGTKGKPGEKLTEPEAEARLKTELASHEARVDAAAAKHGVALTPSMREALVSFDFNTGAVDAVLARKDPQKIAAAMLLYKHADAKAKDASLTKRRQREVAVFWRDGQDEPLPPVNT